MLAAVLGWVLPCQSTPSLLHKRPKGRFGLHAIVHSSLTIHNYNLLASNSDGIEKFNEGRVGINELSLLPTLCFGG